MAKISNKMKIKNADGTFEDIQISYIGPNGTCAEGSGKANGNFSHAEGRMTKANGECSHAEGSDATASGYTSHVEGSNTKANGECSHAEGSDATASGHYSHAEGYYTRASGRTQHVQGKYNIEDATDTYAHIVGNGSSSARSNAHTLDWNGNAWYAGSVTVGEENKKLVCVDDMYPVGSVYMTSTNENPETYLGGNWKLVDKQFSAKVFDSTVDSDWFSLAKASEGNGYAIRSGHSLNIHLEFAIGEVLDDSAKDWIKLSKSLLGLSNTKWQRCFNMYSDDGAGIAMCNLPYSDASGTNLISIRSVKGLTASGNELTSGSHLQGDFTIVSNYSDMLDNACDKFYWKKYEIFTFNYVIFIKK